MRMGSIVPPPGYAATCAQVYILDSNEQVAARQKLSWGSRLNPELLRVLADMLQDVNPFVKVVKQAAEIDDPSYVMYVEATSSRLRERRRYNRPAHSFK